MSTSKLPSNLSATDVATPITDFSSEKFDESPHNLVGNIRNPSTDETTPLKVHFSTKNPEGLPTQSSSEELENFDGKNSPFPTITNFSPATTDETLTPASSAADLESISLKLSSSPKAELYTQLTPAQQRELDAGNIVMTRSSTDSKTLSPEFINSRGVMATALSPTFQAYQITTKPCKTVISAFLNPVNAASFVPGFSGIKYLEPPTTTSSTIQYSLTFQKDALTIADTITLNTNRSELQNGGNMACFEQLEKSTYLRIIKGSLEAVPHGDQTLVSFKVFVDFRGKIIPRLVQNDALESGIEEVFRKIVSLS